MATTSIVLHATPILSLSVQRLVLKNVFFLLTNVDLLVEELCSGFLVSRRFGVELGMPLEQR